MYVFVWGRGGGGGSTQTNIVRLKQNAGNWRRPLSSRNAGYLPCYLFVKLIERTPASPTSQWCAMSTSSLTHIFIFKLVPKSLKSGTNFVGKQWLATASEPLLSGSMTSCCHSVLTTSTTTKKKKTKECTSIGCSAKFLLGVLNFSLYKFSDFVEKRFCHCSLSFQFFFFFHQAICIHCLLHDHPRPNNFIWKKPGNIWGADTGDLCEQKFPTQHPAVCSLLLPLLLESGYECLGFSLHKWEFLPSSKF